MKKTEMRIIFESADQDSKAKGAVWRTHVRDGGYGC